MKIRNKITVWITGVGIITGLLFALPVFLEMIELLPTIEDPVKRDSFQQRADKGSHRAEEGLAFVNGRS